IFVVGSTLACRCAQLPAKDAFCRAGWVSRVRVGQSITVQIEGGFDGRQFGVEHVEVFKNSNNETALPNIVHTSSSSASCGISLDVGEEYLLSGSTTPLVTFLRLLLKIRPEDSPDDAGLIVEWSKVPASFPEKMKKFECESIEQ
ncbi:hypothetical protein PFISCL1PPCAC_13851, partial [Pristionchus fissidentatus]